MKLYIAGPDVFRPDAKAWAEAARVLCAQHGHTALIPLDGAALSAAGIFANNMAMIRMADAVIANLNPFRGSEPDSGTCFEVGVAVALSKPVVGYARDTRVLRERLGAADVDGMHVEDFGLPANLMLAVPTQIVAGELVDALRHFNHR